MYKNMFEFKLEHTIGGGAISELTLYSPRNIHRPITAKIQSMLLNGVLKLSNANKQEQSAPVAQPDSADLNTDEGVNPFFKMKGSTIIQMMKMVPSDNYSFYADLHEQFAALITSDNICKIKSNKDQILTRSYYADIEQHDGDRLMGEYIKHFFTNSLSS